MGTNKYKEAMLAEKIDEARLDELYNMLKNHDDTQAPSCDKENNFRKRIRIPTILAAAILISAIGGTTLLAAKYGGVFKIKSFFESERAAYEIGDDIPVVENPEIYADEVSVDAQANKSSSKLIPRVTIVSGDEHTLVAAIEVDTNGIDMPEGIPEDAVFGFEYTNNNILSGRDIRELRLISNEDGLFTFVWMHSDIKALPEDNVDITLTNFGYTVDNEFVAIVKDTFTISIAAERFKTVEEYAKISEPKDVKGVVLDLKLTAMGILISGSYSDMDKKGLYDDKYYLCQPSIFKFHMNDGRVLGYDDSSIYALICTSHGWVDFDNDISYHHYGFDIPIDIDEISAISVHDVLFEFVSSGEDDDMNTEDGQAQDEQVQKEQNENELPGDSDKCSD